MTVSHSPHDASGTTGGTATGDAPRSLNGTARSIGALATRFFAERQWTRPRYAWHRLWGELNLLPRSMERVWDHAAGDADYAAHMVNGSPDEETLRRTGAVMARRLVTSLDIRPSHTLLEIGPGVGRVGRELAPHVRRWYGADVSRGMLDRSAARMRGQNNTVFVPLPGDGTLPFPAGTFDRAFAHLVFFHIDKQEQWRYLREFARVLKPGGIAYADTWNLENEDGWRRWVAEVAHYEGRKRPVHQNRWSTAAELRAYSERAGLTVLACLADSCWLQLIVARPFADGTLPAPGDLSVLPPPRGAWYYAD